MTDLDAQDPRTGTVPPARSRVRVLRGLAAAVVLGGVVTALPVLAGDGLPLVRPKPAQALPASLERFGDCDAVLTYFHDEAPDYLIARAEGGGRRGFSLFGDGAGSPAMPASGSAEDVATSGGARSTPGHSTTNVQEAGVDEPDLVKTDGKRIVAVAQQRVHLVDAVGGRMTLRATLPDRTVSNVFLSGDRVLVFSARSVDRGFADGSGWAERAVLTVYDIADLAAPRLEATLTLDGSVVDARLVGTQVRVATASYADVDAPSPTYTVNGALSARSKKRLRAAVADTRVDDWLPAYDLRDGSGRRVARGRLVECGDLTRPTTFAGLDTVAVSTFDLAAGLQSRQAVGVVAAGGQQLYATDTSTYVATTDWNRDGAAAATSLHKFVTAPSGASRYTGSGEVPGTLLNSYALSEHRGVLRVASTVAESRGWSRSRSVSEGVVTTLREERGVLRRVGQVGGLGKDDNESIHAVRFIEDKAYVVTFRRTDPLYVLDLRDAAAPKVVGELKIPGYSGYLHPIGEDLLLGAGQSGTDENDPGAPAWGGTGVQFSLFDVSDPTAPRRIDTQTYGGGTAAAEFDPRAFLYWEPRDLILAPTTFYGDEKGGSAFSGLVLLRADRHGLTEVGRLATREADGMAGRSVVIGDVVYALSEQALQAHDLDSHAEIGRLRFFG